jgi:hypothetical protein
MMMSVIVNDSLDSIAINVDMSVDINISLSIDHVSISRGRRTIAIMGYSVMLRD